MNGSGSTGTIVTIVVLLPLIESYGALPREPTQVSPSAHQLLVSLRGPPIESNHEVVLINLVTECVPCEDPGIADQSAGAVRSVHRDRCILLLGKSALQLGKSRGRQLGELSRFGFRLDPKGDVVVILITITITIVLAHLCRILAQLLAEKGERTSARPQLGQLVEGSWFQTVLFRVVQHTGALGLSVRVIREDRGRRPPKNAKENENVENGPPRGPPPKSSHPFLSGQ